MDNYSYAESGDSSPRSRDQLDFDDDHHQQLPPNFRIKFMCSYGGRINPRLHDNQLFYVGGHTKILAVERGIKFQPFMARLLSLCDGYVSFKYQLPGEDLDSLISVTNDDDLDHMMHEYDRMYKQSSSKPARLRLFLFPENPSSIGSYTVSTQVGKSDRERFVDALNTAPAQPPPPNNNNNNNNNVNNDLIFNLEKGTPPPPPIITAEPVISTSDPDPDSDQIQRQIQDLQRLHIASQQQQQPNFYKAPENAMNLPTPPSPAGYWPERHVIGGGGVYQAMSSPPAAAPEQSVYMIPTNPSGTAMYHAPMIRQVANSAGGQGFYIHRINPSDVYGRDQASTYGVVSTAPPGAGVSAPQTTRMAAAYSEGIGYMPQMTYYYNAPLPGGGVMLPPPSPYQPVSAAADHMRAATGLNQDDARTL